jgi:sortase A
MRNRLPQFVERLLLATGLVLLAGYSLARLDSWLSSRDALRTFDERLATRSGSRAPTASVGGVEQVDFRLWSEKRIHEYRDSLVTDTRAPWGVLAIGKVHIRVPIFDGTDDLTLNRGAGWISGTAKPGDAGNIGIAGHRDGFFRGLKDIVEGDVITLTTSDQQADYIVDEIEIVTPERIDVLEPRGSPSLTLVTCYPFYFVGDAPQRFIVHAMLARTAPTRRLD